MGIFIIINYSLLFVHLFDFFSVLFLSLSRSLARSLSPTPPGHRRTYSSTQMHNSLFQGFFGIHNNFNDQICFYNFEVENNCGMHLPDAPFSRTCVIQLGRWQARWQHANNPCSHCCHRRTPCTQQRQQSVAKGRQLGRRKSSLSQRER